jgi:hypothetical protein
MSRKWRSPATIVRGRSARRAGSPVSVNPTENLHENASVAVGGSSVEARSLLSRTLSSLGEKLYWRLIYDADGKNYELSISRLSQ